MLMYRTFLLALISLVPSLLFSQKSVNVVTPGSLSTLISEEERYAIEDLTITGDINGTDLRLLRDMAGNNYKGELTEGKLCRLDLSGANIVAGGENYLDCYVIHLDASASMTDSRGFIFPSKNDTIPQWLFVGCLKLQEISLPKSTKSVEEYAFAECILTKITVPDGIENIGERAFYHNIWITEFNIPKSLKTIGPNAFTYCSGLTKIEIPAGVTEIGKNAFNNCKALTEVRSYMQVPCTITDKTFAVYDKATLYVPTGTKSLYQETAAWNKFQTIVEFDPSTGIASLSLPSIFDVYDLQGRIVLRNTTSVFPLSPGVYVINGQKFVKK